MGDAVKKEYRVAVYCRMANPEPAAIYCRVAQKDQAAIDAQAAIIEQYAKDNCYRVAKCYEDNGYSGSCMVDRPGLKKLMADIRAGEVKTVIVRDLARIGRSFYLVAPWLDWLKEQGVRLIAADSARAEPEPDAFDSIVADWRKGAAKRKHA